jgi:hypothetical protein
VSFLVLFLVYVDKKRLILLDLQINCIDPVASARNGRRLLTASQGPSAESLKSSPREGQAGRSADRPVVCVYQYNVLTSMEVR